MNYWTSLTGTPSIATLAVGDLTAGQRFALWRRRATALGAELLLCLRLDLTGMSKHDRGRWADARSMADLGELVVAWLHGEIAQTPGHCAPPCDETIPLIPFLTAANRAGFVTDNSQLAETFEGKTWNTWISGFATNAALVHLLAAIAGTPLAWYVCGRRIHDCGKARHLLHRCPWDECTGFWAERCPAVADQLRDCWYVTIEDPEPGRNDRLWPALEAFAKTALQAQGVGRS